MKELSLSKHILTNGLNVFYCHTPNLVSFEISMHINTGSRDETEKNSGISHFLEHMMFRGCSRFPNSIELSRALESFGGETNAMTSVENTTYWLKGDTEKTLTAIEYFADFFLHPNFADLEIERSVILEEMASDFNDSGDSIDTETLGMSTLFSEHPIGNPIIGTKEIVSKISIRELSQKRTDFYFEKNCILTINTSLAENLVIEACENYFGKKWEHCNNPNPERISAENLIPQIQHSKKPQNALCLQNNPDNQFALKFMLPTEGGMSKNVILTTFLQRILDDGICTRLPATIREKYGLVYDISCDTQFFTEIGTFNIDAIVSEDNLHSLFDKLSYELKKILVQEPHESEVEHIRFRYCFDLKLVKENPSRLLNREVSLHFMNKKFSIDEEISIVKSIQPHEILAIAKNIIGSAKRSLILVGPKSRKKRDIVEKFLKTFDIL